MSELTIKSASVVIKYATSAGSRSEFSCKGGKGTKHLRTGDEIPSKDALLDALRHLALITVFHGFSEEALATFSAEQERVATWKAENAA